MTRSEIAEVLNTQLRELVVSQIRTDLYVFGSYPREGDQAGDIDLLFVYQENTIPARVRELFSRKPVPFPVDLLFLHVDEFRESDFLSKVEPLLLYSGLENGKQNPDPI